MVRREVAVVDDVDAEDEDEDDDEATPFSILFRLVGGWDDGPPAIGSAANDTLETFFAIILWYDRYSRRGWMAASPRTSIPSELASAR